VACVVVIIIVCDNTLAEQLHLKISTRVLEYSSTPNFGANGLPTLAVYPLADRNLLPFPIDIINRTRVYSCT
jgi:hypothetical protein